MEDGRRKINDRIKELCSDFLGGLWSDLQSSEIDIKTIENGKSNRIFVACLPDALKHSIHEEPSKVLVRFYGSEWTGEGNRFKLIGEAAEAVVFSLLAERKIGPKLYGIFDGGRLEEFIESRSVSAADFMDETAMKIMAQRIAAIHCMKMPVPKKNIIIAAFKQLKENVMKLKIDETSLSERNRDLWKQISKFDYLEEADFMTRVYATSKQKLTFCHNDINLTNILMTIDENENSDKNMIIIDFENCYFSYRGIDIGKFFAENMIFDNKEVTVYPSDDKIDCFVTEYLIELKRISECFDEKIDNRDTLTLEIHCGRMLTHIFTSLWNMVHPNFCDDKFQLFENAAVRITLYKRLKQSFLKKFPQFN